MGCMLQKFSNSLDYLLKSLWSTQILLNIHVTPGSTESSWIVTFVMQRMDMAVGKFSQVRNHLSMPRMYCSGK